MSITDSAIPPGGQNSTASMVSLNELFKESLRKVQAGTDMNMVVRCQVLPVIRGRREEMENLFDTLVRMIVHGAPYGSRRYLYVDCEEELRVSANSVNEDSKKYVIKFYTNTIINDGWKESHRLMLDKCETIVSSYHGNFTMNNIRDSGCLFSITLPGKFE